MKKVLITKDCKYAQSKPSMPILEFVEDGTYDLEDSLADSIIRNGHGILDEVELLPLSEAENLINSEIKENPRKGRRKGNKS